MSSGARVAFRPAFFAALAVGAELQGTCERIEVVGSLRRMNIRTGTVGDIELLVVPKFGPGKPPPPPPTADLFGKVEVAPVPDVDLFEERVAELLKNLAHPLKPHPTDEKNGPRYKKLWRRHVCSGGLFGNPSRCLSHEGRPLGFDGMCLGGKEAGGIQVDLFVARPPTQFGPAMVVRTGPADFSKGMVTALHAFDLHLEEFQVKRKSTGEVVPCPDEQTFFKLARRPWLPPEERR